MVFQIVLTGQGSETRRKNARTRTKSTCIGDFNRCQKKGQFLAIYQTDKGHFFRAPGYYGYDFPFIKKHAAKIGVKQGFL